MPEGPELYKAAQLVNKACKNQVFTGKIVKSAVNVKNPEIEHGFKEYTIRAESRGKEMALTLSLYPQEVKTKNTIKDLRILFRFGMSGRFQFGSIADMHKHAHLNFFTKLKKDKSDDGQDGNTGLILSFVDVRRFGGWQIQDTWSKERGPDPIFEYEEFRSNILNNLDASAFNKPLCEVLHNQKYFNGIGNYLRAETIFRSGTPPFTRARDVLEKLKIMPDKNKTTNSPDILELCHIVPSEVIKLSGVGYDASGAYSDYSAFQDWLQCYYNPDMNNLVDHDGRTIWFKGQPGPMAPKARKSRNAKNHGKRKAGSKTEKLNEEVKVEELGNPAKIAKASSTNNAKPNKSTKKTKVSRCASKRVSSPQQSVQSGRNDAAKRVHRAMGIKGKSAVNKHQNSSSKKSGKNPSESKVNIRRSSTRLRSRTQR